MHQNCAYRINLSDGLAAQSRNAFIIWGTNVRRTETKRKPNVYLRYEYLQKYPVLQFRLGLVFKNREIPTLTECIHCIENSVFRLGLVGQSTNIFF